MASIVSIRDGLASALGSISGLRVLSYAADKVTVPQAQVGEVSIDFAQTAGNNLDELEVKVRVYASRADDRAGQDKLDGYLATSGATSILAALEADRTLGGVAQSLLVTRLEGYGVYDVAGTSYLGAEFTVTVWARRS